MTTFLLLSLVIVSASYVVIVACRRMIDSIATVIKKYRNLAKKLQVALENLHALHEEKTALLHELSEAKSLMAAKELQCEDARMQVHNIKNEHCCTLLQLYASHDMIQELTAKVLAAHDHHASCILAMEKISTKIEANLEKLTLERHTRKKQIKMHEPVPYFARKIHRMKLKKHDDDCEAEPQPIRSLKKPANRRSPMTTFPLLWPKTEKRLIERGGSKK